MSFSTGVTIGERMTLEKMIEEGNVFEEALGELGLRGYSQDLRIIKDNWPGIWQHFSDRLEEDIEAGLVQAP